jgi:hypothetical protein
MHMYSAKKPKERLNPKPKNKLDINDHFRQPNNLIVNGPSMDHLFGQQR